MFCTSCGHTLRDSARFCRDCGAPTALLRLDPEIRIWPDEPAQPPVCPACGAALTPESRFCARCGAPVEQKREARCQYCNAPLEGEPRFCECCGGRVVTLR